MFEPKRPTNGRRNQNIKIIFLFIFSSLCLDKCSVSSSTCPATIRYCRVSSRKHICMLSLLAFYQVFCACRTTAVPGTPVPLCFVRSRSAAQSNKDVLPLITRCPRMYRFPVGTLWYYQHVLSMHVLSPRYERALTPLPMDVES